MVCGYTKHASEGTWFDGHEAPGSEKIFHKLIQQLPIDATDQLVEILKKCFAIGYWPQVWKMAKVVPIKKANNSPNLEISYRQLAICAKHNFWESDPEKNQRLMWPK